MTPTDQARVFLAMALCGACIGATDDVLGLCTRGAWMRAAADLALGVFGGLCVIAAGLTMQCEVFRLYTLLGVALGWGIYGLSLGTIVRTLTKRFTKCQKK